MALVRSSASRRALQAILNADVLPFLALAVLA
jgi:hypothetical protein